MERKIGVEIEFYGVNVADTAAILSDLYGGDIHIKSHSQASVKNTKFGDITVELDARMAHQISDFSNNNQDNEFLKSLDEAGSELLRLASVPVEIVFPPVTVSELKELDDIILALRDAGAEGTQGNPIFAFGVHLNVSTGHDDASYFKNMLLAFFLLQYWLAEKTREDFSRIVSGYNKLYPHKFGVKLMGKDFENLRDVIDFYQYHIKDRNYALDMYPLWAHLDPDAVSGKKAELVKARPTFHYRLPDCKLGQDGWNFSQEYDWWLEVENLAHDIEKLNAIADDYRKKIKSFTDPMGRDWLKNLKTKWGYDGEK